MMFCGGLVLLLASFALAGLPVTHGSVFPENAYQADLHGVEDELGVAQSNLDEPADMRDDAPVLISRKEVNCSCDENRKCEDYSYIETQDHAFCTLTKVELQCVAYYQQGRPRLHAARELVKEMDCLKHAIEKLDRDTFCVGDSGDTCNIGSKDDAKKYADATRKLAKKVELLLQSKWNTDMEIETQRREVVKRMKCLVSWLWRFQEKKRGDCTQLD